VKRLINFILVALLVVVAFTSVEAKVSKKTKLTPVRTSAVVKVSKKQANPLKIFYTLYKFLTPFIKRGYDTFEPVFINQPEKMPKEYKCSVDGSYIPVHAKSAPTGAECARVINAYLRLKRNTSGNFWELLGTNNPATFQGWNIKPKDFRTWLVENAPSVVGAETESVKGCNLLLTHNSSTGRASEIVGGLKFMWGGEVKPVYPFIAVARQIGANASRPECQQLEENSFYHGDEHRATVYKGTNGQQSYRLFVGESDFHPIFKDKVQSWLKGNSFESLVAQTGTNAWRNHDIY
jgi:hypothetical protein